MSFTFRYIYILKSLHMWETHTHKYLPCLASLHIRESFLECRKPLPHELLPPFYSHFYSHSFALSAHHFNRYRALLLPDTLHCIAFALDSHRCNFTDISISNLLAIRIQLWITYTKPHNVNASTCIASVRTHIHSHPHTHTHSKLRDRYIRCINSTWKFN